MLGRWQEDLSLHNQLLYKYTLSNSMEPRQASVYGKLLLRLNCFRESFETPSLTVALLRLTQIHTLLDKTGFWQYITLLY